MSRLALSLGTEVATRVFVEEEGCLLRGSFMLGTQALGLSFPAAQLHVAVSQNTQHPCLSSAPSRNLL